MTERTMLLRCAAADRYVIMGTDFPSARVFDTATSALSAVVELPPRHRSALSSISLTAVALGSLTQQQHSHNNNEEEDVAQEADLLQTYYAAVGLSNGTVLVHNITRDVLVDHVLLSSTQRAVRSMSIAGPCLVALCEDNMVYLLDLTQPQLGLRGRIPVPPGATAVATSVENITQSEASNIKETVLHILVAGPAITVLRVRFHATGAAVHDSQRGPEVNQLMSFASQGTGVDYCWIGYDANHHGSESNITRRLVAVTASAQEGMIRIWDVSSESSQAQRCRRTLLCGQRMANLCVQSAYNESKEYFNNSSSNIVVATTFTGAVLVWNLGHELLPRIAEPLPLQPALVLIADKGTSRLLYGFLRPPSLLTNTTHEETTTAENATITTKKTKKKKSTGDVEAALRHVALLLLRGRFALPLFEDIQLARLLEVNRNSGYSRAARQLLMSTGLQSVTNGTVVSNGKEERSAQGAMRVLPVPMSDALTTNKAAMTHETRGDNRKRSNGLSGNNEAAGAAMAFEVADTVWANHRAQVAAKATMTATESFPAVRAHRAASTKELPIQHLSLEQRLRRLQNETASNDAVGDTAEQQTSISNNQGLAATTTTTTSNALGLATVPLYQALHASDTTAVMELLSIAARSHAGMRATVLSLQLPYCLQLLHILSLRLGILANSSQPTKNELTGDKKADAESHTKEEGVLPSADTQGNNNTNDVVKPTGAVVGGGLAATSLRSPLLEWVDCIIQYRGMELYAAQQEAKGTQLMTNPSETMSSPPKDFIAPILHQYRVTCAQYDKLATMYGRLSIFQGVRASEKNVFYQHSRKMQSSNLERGSAAAAATQGHKSKQQQLSEGKEWTGAGAVLQDDLIFPAMFAEVRTRRGGLRAVRVRSRLELAQARRRKATKDAALLRRAKALARDADNTDINSKNGKKKGKSILDESDDDEGDEHAGKRGSVLDEMALAQMDNNDGELDLDELAAMQLDSSSEEEEGEEEEVSEEEGAGGQVARARMLADDPTAVGYAGAAREKDNMDEEASRASSEAEFSSASDDVLDSEAESEDDDEDESESDEDEENEEGDESDEDKRAFGSQDDDDDEEDDEDNDGMGEDMQELLAEHETAEDRTEKRKSKRLRVD